MGTLALSIYAIATAVVHGSIGPAITYVNLAIPVLVLPLTIGLLRTRELGEGNESVLAPWTAGVALGLAFVAIVAGIEFVFTGRARFLSDHPNQLAHGAVLMGTAVLLGGSRVPRSVGWGSVILIAVFAASRTAMLAWAIGSVAYLLLPSNRRRGRSISTWVLPAAIAGTAIAVLLTLPRWTSVWYAVVPPSNLLVDTEDLTRSSWRRHGLTVTPSGHDAPRAFELARDGGPAWQRVQQDVWLGPGQVSVTLFGVASNGSDTTPALSLRAASATASEGPEPLAVSVRSTPDGGVAVASGPRTRVRSATATDAVGGTELHATVEFDLPVATLFTFGVSPSHVDGPGAAIVHSLMVTTKGLGTYVPGLHSKWLVGRMAVTQRLAFYATAVSLTQERLGFGWGTIDVQSIMESADVPVDPRLEGHPLAHAHNAALQIALTFGSSGLALLLLLALVSVPKTSRAIVPIVMFVMLQTLDFTLLNGAVLWAATVAVASAALPRTRPHPHARLP